MWGIENLGKSHGAIVVNLTVCDRNFEFSSKQPAEIRILFEFNLLICGTKGTGWYEFFLSKKTNESYLIKDSVVCAFMEQTNIMLKKMVLLSPKFV